MGQTFGEKFEAALAALKEQEPSVGLRTIARRLAGPNATHEQIEVIRRRLNKYRPPKGGGAAAVKEPTQPARWELEKAMGLKRDSLKPDKADAIAARQVPVMVTLDYDLLAAAVERRDAKTADRVKAKA